MMNQIVPDMRIQVTSEAAGIYASDQQIALLETLEALGCHFQSEKSVEINRMIDSRLFFAHCALAHAFNLSSMTWMISQT
jgi:hypothetical protein